MTSSTKPFRRSLGARLALAGVLAAIPVAACAGTAAAIDPGPGVGVPGPGVVVPHPGPDQDHPCAPDHGLPGHPYLPGPPFHPGAPGLPGDPLWNCTH